MYECGGDDDAGAEVSSEEIDVDGNAEAGNAFCDDGEEGRAAGADEDDEEGGYSGAELAVVFVIAKGHGAYYLVARLAADVDWVVRGVSSRRRALECPWESSQKIGKMQG